MKPLYPIKRYDRRFPNFSYYRFVENELLWTNADSCGKFLGNDFDNLILKRHDNNILNRFNIILKDFEREMNEIRKVNRK